MSKIKILIWLFLTIQFSSPTSSSISAQMLEVPLGDDLHRDTYDFIDRMVARKAVTALFKNTLPYSHAEVARILIELETKPQHY